MQYSTIAPFVKRAELYLPLDDTSLADQPGTKFQSHFRQSKTQPTAKSARASRLRCRKMRQGGPPPSRNPATIGLAAAPSSNRALTYVQPLLDPDQPGRHHRAVSRREPVRWQSGADAGGFSQLQGTDRAQRSRGPKTRNCLLRFRVLKLAVSVT